MLHPGDSVVKKVSRGPALPEFNTRIRETDKYIMVHTVRAVKGEARGGAWPSLGGGNQRRPPRKGYV